MCRHAPGAGLATFGYHDGELVHGVGLEGGDSVAESRGVCRLKHKQLFEGFGSFSCEGRSL